MTQDRWDGSQYRENSDPQEGFARAALDRLDLKGHERVVDIGCGDGRITAEIARRVANGHVLGLDGSPSMVAACTQERGAQPNLAFRVAEATTFETEGGFDVAVSFSALHWVADLPAALRRIHEALRPGGELLIGMGGGHQKEIAEVFTRDRWRTAMSKRSRSFHGRTRDELSSMLTDCLFENVRVKALEGARPYESDKALLDWIMAWLPHASGLSGETAIEMGQEIVCNVRAAMAPGQTPLVLRSTMLLARATRG